MKVFVTLRVAGPTLNPDEITAILGVYPTHTHRTGKTYSTGRSSITPKSGLWMLSTNKILMDTEFDTHLRLMLLFLGLDKLMRDDRSGAGIGAFRLAAYLQRDASLSATVSFFWHGSGSKAIEPSIPKWLGELLELLRIRLEIDFDKDEPVSPRATRAA